MHTIMGKEIHFFAVSRELDHCISILVLASSEDLTRISLLWTGGGRNEHSVVQIDRSKRWMMDDGKGVEE